MTRYLTRLVISWLWLALYQVPTLCLANGIQQQDWSQISQLIMFGDSLSDTGNTFELTSALHSLISNIHVIPDAPYVNGHFTNGKVWEEYLLEQAFHFSSKDDQHFLNYSYGGAWAEGDKISGQAVPPSLTRQVNNYLYMHRTEDKSQSLYLILIGGNDYIGYRDSINYATDQAMGSIKSAIDSLLQAGAHNIVLANLPDLDKTPRAGALNLYDYLFKVTTMHNEKLARLVDSYYFGPMGTAHADIRLLDTHLLFNKILDSAPSYDLHVLNEPCLLPELDEVNGGAKPIIDAHSLNEDYDRYSSHYTHQICNNPEYYLFWDDIHPTTKAHWVLATEVCKLWYEEGLIVADGSAAGRALDCDNLLAHPPILPLN